MLDMTAFGERLIKADLALPPLLRSCTEAEISGLEKQAGGRLPAIYRSFLKVMGKGAGNFLRGSDCFYQYLPELRSWAEKLLSKLGITGALPADAFVFSMHQGYEFMFFRLGEGDDPPVYQFVEGMSAPSRPWESFSAFLEDSLAQHVEMYERMF